MSRALKDRRIHVERRKRWGTLSVFLAEWFASSVAYCQTPEGKKQFEEWMQEQYREQTPQILALCYAGPRRRYGTSTGNVDMFNKAAYELGILSVFGRERSRYPGTHSSGARQKTRRSVIGLVSSMRRGNAEGSQDSKCKLG
ncbi:hypothetical protein BOTBODRAFT_347354 [Botryobasidium botryosum FD-172 SS1]|uniref:Uncharacterized protein n=1 Tax=Botryobasidium botryosum (strain FD-172 SS1) TaxID=930990 RepID=A0A067MFD9_BOTB1|nr:hypothetical protein BOTBODRAFT_347354 [Botryobasidium botryosum FD-172 SS1]